MIWAADVGYDRLAHYHSHICCGFCCMWFSDFHLVWHWLYVDDVTFRSCMLYPLLRVGWNTSMLERWAARRVRLCLPLPPTPTSRAWPLGHARMRLIRHLQKAVKTTVCVITVKSVFTKAQTADVALTHAAWLPGTAPGSWQGGVHCNSPKPHWGHSWAAPIQLRACRKVLQIPHCCAGTSEAPAILPLPPFPLRDTQNATTF